MSPEEEILKKYGTPIEGTDVDVESDILSKYGTPIKKKEDTAFALETGSLEFPENQVVDDGQVQFKTEDLPEGVGPQGIDLTPIEDLLTSLEEKSQLTDDQKAYVEDQIIAGFEKKPVSATFLRTGVSTGPSETEYERQKPKLLKEYSKAMGVREDLVTDEQLSGYFSNKKRKMLYESLQDQNREDYISFLTASDKDQLERYKVKKYDEELSKELPNKIALDNLMADQYMSRVQKGDYVDEAEKTELIGKAYDHLNRAGASREKLLTAEKEIDLLKRGYGTAENVIGKATASTFEILSGVNKFFRDIEPVLNPVGYAARVATGVQEEYEKESDQIDSFLERIPEKIRGSLRKTKSVSDINSIGDFAEWATDITSETTPQILTLAATGGATGLGILGSSAYGNKLNQLEKEEEIADKDLYSPFEKRVAAALTAGAEVASEKVSLGILNKGKRVMQSAIKQGAKQEVLDKVRGTLTERITKGAKQLWTESEKEAWSEVGAQLSENIVDKYLLGKDINLYDGITDVYAAGKLMGLLMHSVPQVGAELMKPFVSQNTQEQLGNNIKEIIELSENYEDLSDATKVVIDEQVAEIDSKNNKIIDDNVKAVSNLPTEQAGKVLDLDKQLKDISDKAEVVRNDDVLNNVQKTTTLNSLREQYEQVSKEKNQIVSNSMNEVNRPIQEKQGEEKFEEALTEEETKVEKVEEPKVEKAKDVDKIFDKTIPTIERKKVVNKEYGDIKNEIDSKEFKDVFEDLPEYFEVSEDLIPISDKYQSIKDDIKEIDEIVKSGEIDDAASAMTEKKLKGIFESYNDLKAELESTKEIKQQKEELLTIKPKKDVQVKQKDVKEKVAIDEDVKTRDQQKRREPIEEGSFERRYKDEIDVAKKEGVKGKNWTYAEGKFTDADGDLIQKPSAEIQKEFQDKIIEMSKEASKRVSIKEAKKIDISESIGLNKAISIFEDFDKAFTKAGKEQFSMGLPIVIAQGSVKTIKAGLQAGKTVADAISDGINYMRETGWYKNLTDKQKKHFDENFEEELEKARDEAVRLERRREERKPSEERLKEIDLEKELNRNIREPEKAKGLVSIKENVFFDVDNISDQAKKLFFEYFRTRGNLPSEVFKRKVGMTSEINYKLKELNNTVSDFRNAAKKTYGKDFNANDKFDIDLALRGDKKIIELPKGMQDVVSKMRDDIDELSNEMVKYGVVQGDLIGDLTENLGVYLTRSYQAHDDKKWKDKVPEEIKNKAISFLRKEFPDLKETELDNIIYDLLTIKDAPLAFLRGGKLGSKDISVLKKKKDIPVEIRMLLGEYKDPLVNYARSITKMVNLLEKHKFLSDVKLEGEGKFLFKKSERPPGGKYTYEISGKESKVMNPLNGMYTTPEIGEAFESFGAQVKNMPGYWRVYMMVNAAVKWGKTVGSYMGQVRNFLSNPIQVLKNGNLFSGGFLNSTMVTLTELFDLPSKKYRERYKNYIRRGIVNDDSTIGDVKLIISETIGSTSSVDILLDKQASMFTKNLKKGLNFANKAWQAGDDFWKIYNFEAEKKKYKKAFPEWDENQVEEKAAEITRATMPYYSLTPKMIQELRKFPYMGAFPSFAAEQIRNVYNVIEISKNEMKDPKTRSIGVKRLGGLMAALTVTGAMAKFFRYWNNVDEEEDKDARKGMAPWSKYSEILWMSGIKNGQGEYIDLGYSDPLAMFKKPIVAAIVGDEPIKAFTDAVVNQTLSPFIGEEVLLGALLDLNKEGKVYKKSDTDGEKFSKILTHLVKTVEPGTVTSLRRIWKGYYGETVNGKKYDVVNETIALMTGQRRSILDMKSSMSYKIYNLKKDILDAESKYAKAKYNEGLTKEEVKDQYKKAQNAYNKYFEEIRKDYEAAKNLGVDPKELKKMMKMYVRKYGKLSKKEINAITRGDDIPKIKK